MLGLRECLELNNICVTSALTPHTSTIDSFTLKRSLKLLRWGTIVAAYWGIQGTSPNENVSKLETDRQTKSQRLWTKTDRRRQERERKSKRAIKKKKRKLLVSETMTFLPIESDAWAVAISMSLTELRAYQAYCITWKKSERVEIIKNASEIMHFSDSIHHCFGTLDPLREVSEQREGGEALAPAPTAKEEDR